MGANNSAIADSTAYVQTNLRDIEFALNEDEVENIRNGVEFLISSVLADISDIHINKIRKDWVESVRNKITPSQTCRSNMQAQVTNKVLIKVGSFYEETKNYFPNEFEFIFIIGTFEAIGMSLVHLFLDSSGKDFLSQFQDLLTKQISSKHSDYDYKTSNVHLRIDNVIAEVTQPASSTKLLFLYENEIGHTYEINVYLYPAFQINDPFLTEEILIKHGICSSIPDFNRHIVETGSYAITNFSKISFAETELRFMKEILSSRHRTVYRLVKHLINGRDMYEHLKSFCSRFIHSVVISSHQIKKEIIAHHFVCREGMHTDESKSIKSCAAEIILDLGFQVEAYRKRSIVKFKGTRNTDLADVNVWYNTWAESPESNEFRNFGSDYLKLLGNSLNPGLMTSLLYRFNSIDKSYSQYMIENKSKFFGDHTPEFFEADGLCSYFSVGTINNS